MDFLIPYATFKEMTKEKNIKMALDRDEFDLPGWIRGQLNNMVGMVGNLNDGCETFDDGGA